jgi:glutamate-1-semialdehyde aminotransferase
LIDVDGNVYVDVVNGYGQTALGHSPPFVVAAISEQLAKGFPIGPQAELTGKVAALFCELTGNERATFCNTGSEAVMAAMRVARTVTGREKIVVFNGDYHGQFDEVLVKGVQKPGAPPRSMPVAPGIPVTTAQNMVVLEYGTEQTLKWITDNAHEIAAVVVEPVQSRHPNLRPFEFLRQVRAITEAAGAAFVMDEVVTGFRVHPGGMQAVIGIRADLATYGKIVGGGLPVGVLAGKAKFMDALDGGNWNYGDDSIPETGVTFFAGTFVRHPLLLASAWAVLNHLKEHGPALQATLTEKTSRLVERLNALFASRGIATRIETFASWFYFNFHNEHPLASLFYYHARLRGIHIQDGFPCFLTTAHSEEDIEQIYQAFADSIAEMQSVGILGLTEAHRAPTPVPLTESQLEIWLAAQLGDEASCAFNESVSLAMHGRLDPRKLDSAMTRVLARHDALRATFSSTGEEMRRHRRLGRPPSLRSGGGSCPARTAHQACAR